ncbi:Holliday junction branch migration protein RuvA [Haoranjiania flava]|uniref:Holliday junction branch migration complex subunit RuvA n=1 Tax=Haoranjiania flava TaxID=1856322 RepID=A0AAE3IKR9_9BACT|nr:Holliday junction branch migration protein RuvA [Haoranjiania flava]MCU7693514.1 Holliday junction branch migration protein RuvA [Haoranjiania flava]
MIAFVKGKFVNKTPANVIVDVNDLGYDVNISLHTYSAIAELDSGLLYTHLQITENAQTLYGFFSLQEKELFLQLINVSGVGASTARMMLSGMKPEEIVKAIVQQNVKQLETIKGIGKKTAERLIVELKDKLAKQHNENVAGVSDVASVSFSNVGADAVTALIALGINRLMAENAVKKAEETLNNPRVEELIKTALKNI